jgi:DNA-binding MarR family transcriptional regulator
MPDTPDRPPDHHVVPLLLDPTRLRLVATLAAGGEVEFAFVRDRVGLSDSALSKQLRILGHVDIVGSRREPTGPRRRVWLRLTPHGRTLLATHVQALREIASTAEGPPDTQGSAQSNDLE